MTPTFPKKEKLVNLLKISLIIFFLSFAGSASATHFRYGNLTWSRDPGNPLTINFKLTESWRRGYPWTSLGTPNPTNPITSDLINFYGSYPLNFGDGGTANVILTVTSFSAAEDWIFGEFNVSHTYASNGSFLAFMEGAARLSGPPSNPTRPLQNNGDLSFRIESNVTIGNGNDAPVSTLPPIVNLVIGNPVATYQIPATDPNGDALTFSLAPSASFTQTGEAGCNNPLGFSVTSGGLMTFNTINTFYTPTQMSIGNFFNAVIRITDTRGAYVHLDVLLKIVGPSAPPVYFSPTPPDQFIYTIAPGSTLNYSVNAKDPDAADNVTLFVNGLPIGAAMSPPLPFTGPTNNFALSNFSWTPTVSQVGSYVTTFIAQDPQGVQTPTTVKVNVVCNSSFTTTVTEPSCFNTTDGSITVTASGTAPFMFSNNGGATYLASANPYTFSGLGQGDYGIRVKGANGCESAVSNVHVGLNLVANGDFEAGNSGFTTNYTLNTVGIIDEGEYAVEVLPNHPCFTGPDHTTYGPGNAMHINGSGVANTVVWAQNIAVQPNTNYYFSAWVKGQCFNSNPAILQFSINGGQIGSNFSPTDATTWRQFFTPWNSGTNTSASIRLINQNTGGSGNDFSLDDIVFTTIAPVTEAVTKTDVNCIGANDGTITVNAAGGIAPYKYSIDGGTNYIAGSNPYTFSGLAPGNYDVLVKDNCGVESNVQVVTIGTVPDVTLPVITCPAPIVVNNTPGLCSAPVTVPVIAVSDNCGVICNTDDLDSYPAGPVSGQSSLWVPWAAGSASAVVSTEQFFSSPNSLKVAYNATNNPDQLYLLGNQTTGKWTVKFKMFVVGGSSGYYNIQHFETSAIQWAHQVIFYSNGTGRLFAGPATPFNYPQNQWFEIRQEINQITNQTSLYINNIFVRTWQFSNQFNGAAGANQLGAIDFFATNAGAFGDPNPAASSLFYVDDVTLCGAPAPMGVYIARRYSKVYPVGVHSVPVSISDLSGNTAGCNLSITVRDNEIPTITCPGAVSVQCAAAVPAPNTALVTASDNCSTVTVSFVSDVISNQTCANKYTLTRTYKATDAAGNFATCEQIITVNDDMAPQLTGVLPGGASGNLCKSAATPAPNAASIAALYTDNCNGVVTATLIGTAITGTDCSWTATYTYSIVDACNNAAANAIVIFTGGDTQIPTFTRPADKTIYTTANCSYDASVTATGDVTNEADNCSTGLNATYTDVTANGSCQGSKVITRTWHLVDNCNNAAADQVQTITVSDNIKPTAICKNVTIALSGGTAILNPALVNNGSFDNCSDVTLSVSPSTFNCSNAGVNTVTLTVTDACGNASTCTATVTVLERPTCSIASVPANNVYTGGVPTNIYLGYGPQTTNLTVSAPASGAPYTYKWIGYITGLSSTTSSSPLYTPTATGSYTFTVEVTNKYGCKSTCSITICVLDIRERNGNGSTSGKVYLCHVPPGNPGNANTLSISVNAVPAHLGNHIGDHLGKCTDVICGSSAPFVQTTEEIKEQPVIITLPAAAGFEVNVYPNPTAGDFNIQVISGSTEPAMVRILNVNGTVVQSSTKMTKQGFIGQGYKFPGGTYFVEVTQGNNRKVVKLVRMN